MTRVDRVGLRNAELRGVEFLVGGNELGSGIQGVLGRNFLTAGDTEYDLAHGLVVLSFPKGNCSSTNLAHWAGKAPVIEVPLWAGGHNSMAINIPVKVNGKELRALMDTGAPATALSLAAARSAGIAEGALQSEGSVGGAGQGRVRNWMSPVDLFEVGGQKITNTRLAVNDVSRRDQDLLLGLDYFLAHRVYVSYLQDKVYITWNGSAVFVRRPASERDDDARDAAPAREVSNDDADALARRGAAAIATGHCERALLDLNRACELAPGVADHVYSRARLHLAMREPTLALADLDRALQIDPGMSEARARRADLRARRGDAAGAKADLEQLDASLPPASALRADMADLFSRLNLAPQALAQYDQWLDTHPRDAARAEALNGRCWLRTRLNLDLPKALQDCKDAVAADELSAENLDSLGWTYLRLGNAAKARSTFDAAIKLRPLAMSHYGRAMASRRLQDVAPAEQDLATARRLDTAVDAQVRREGFDFPDLPQPGPAGAQ